MPFKKKDIENLLAATGRKCCICGTLHNVQVHHIIEKKQGGSDEIENAIPLCPSCHDRVHVKPSTGRTTRDYSPEELRLHRNRTIKEFRSERQEERSNIDEKLNMMQKIWEEPHDIEKVILPKVALSSLAENDCQRLNIIFKDAQTFVKGEISRHPLMFQQPFSSLPIIFGDNILLLNWDCHVARIERILNRQEAYPLNDLWTECLGFYRKATLLPYRTQQTGRLLISSDAKLAIAVFRNLAKYTEQFLLAIEQQTKIRIQVGVKIQQFLDEAEFALVNEDVGTAIARLEIVLSTVHKLLLRHAPQGVGVKEDYQTENPKFVANIPGIKSILIVDDHSLFVTAVIDILKKEGYQCQGTTSSHEALQLLVERDFDLIITDLIMPDRDGLTKNSLDGRELVLAAKKSGSKAKIIVLSMYMEMGLIAEAGSNKFPCDSYIAKDSGISDLIAIVKELLNPHNGGNETG